MQWLLAGVLHQQPANRIGGQSDVEVLNARKVYWLGNKIQKILLAIEDITERARLEREHAAAHERMLLQELTHRVKNSLQFIAGTSKNRRFPSPCKSDSRLSRSERGRLAWDSLASSI